MWQLDPSAWLAVAETERGSATAAAWLATEASDHSHPVRYCQHVTARSRARLARKADHQDRGSDQARPLLGRAYDGELLALVLYKKGAVAVRNLLLRLSSINGEREELTRN